MPITLGSNISSLRALRQVDATSDRLRTTFERLSSGQRINRASDDAAGLAISTALNVSSRVYTQALRNISDAVSVIAIASGAVEELKGVIMRQRELAVQAAQGALSGRQRLALQHEANELANEYNRILESTEFNGRKLLDGSDDTVRLQLGFGLDESLVMETGAGLGDRAGTGVFTAGATVGGSRSVAAGDLDNDGDVDLVVTSGIGQLTIQLGDGTGTFATGVTIAYSALGAARSREIQLADLNNDGALDIVTGSDNDTISVALNHGNGTFRAAVSYSTGLASGTSSIVSDLDLRDVNSDGALDVVAGVDHTAGSDGGVSILYGRAGGTFGPAMTLRAADQTYTVKFADMDGDGTLDILSTTVDTLYLNRGLGGGSFANATTLASHGSAGIRGLDVGDLDRDGDIDLVLNSYAAGPRVYYNNGQGTLTGGQTLSVPGVSAEARFADLNGDGYLDLATATSYSFTIGVAINRGDGTLSPSVSYATSNETDDVAFGDFNNDGAMDFVSSLGETFINTLDPRGRRSVTQSAFDLLSTDSARAAMKTTSEFLDRLNAESGQLGVLESRLLASAGALGSRRMAMDEANSRIIDTDMAESSAELVRSSVTRQAAAAVLAQANLQPALALRLLAG